MWNGRTRGISFVRCPFSLGRAASAGEPEVRCQPLPGAYVSVSDHGGHLHRRATCRRRRVHHLFLHAKGPLRDRLDHRRQHGVGERRRAPPQQDRLPASRPHWDSPRCAQATDAAPASALGRPTERRTPQSLAPTKEPAPPEGVPALVASSLLSSCGGCVRSSIRSSRMSPPEPNRRCRPEPKAQRVQKNLFMIFSNSTAKPTTSSVAGRQITPHDRLRHALGMR